ncbi:hypothetical protein [Caldisalinibacter kiritimatiensis]|uniref:Uncharacterized protein n=1 Tax=Caldisalinibacter kiritimatiensis TaxID=1304284 RepID=R1ATD3_9FIRM|nr:hypothetical protein [Caldisalinibacter kiritimatiensis]EOD00383.1 hypothetical protein L21TH_1574 [Caldisalinibacter kiritimatiensis]
MKKILIFTLIIVLILGCFQSSYAQQDDLFKKHNLKFNEYQYFKELQSKSMNELKEMGFSNDKIRELKEFDYVKAIKERAKLSKEELKKLGYNDEQISIFKNFNETEEEVIALSAELNEDFYVFVSGRDTAEPYSYITLFLEFEWSSCPIWTLSDAIGISWSDGMKVNMNGTNFTVNYVGGSTSYDWDVPLNVTPGTGIDAKWGLRDSLTGSWAKSGEGYIAINRYEYLNDVEIVFKYAHGIVYPNLSVSVYGTPSVSFSGYHTIEANKYIRHYFQ